MLPCSSSAQMEGCDLEERDAHMETEVNGSEPEPWCSSWLQILSDCCPNRTFSGSSSRRPASPGGWRQNPSLHAPLLAIFPEKSGVKFTSSWDFSLFMEKKELKEAAESLNRSLNRSASVLFIKWLKSNSENCWMTSWWIMVNLAEQQLKCCKPKLKLKQLTKTTLARLLLNYI